MNKKFFAQLIDAGGRVDWYNSVRWNRLPRYNNRTHRELLIIDGKVGFIGGAGIGDHWMFDKGKNRRWRDTMVRVEGDAVPHLQATLAENWLEASGEVLNGPEYFPMCKADRKSAMLVVTSRDFNEWTYGLATRLMATHYDSIDLRLFGGGKHEPTRECFRSFI